MRQSLSPAMAWLFRPWFKTLPFGKRPPGGSATKRGLCEWRLLQSPRCWERMAPVLADAAAKASPRERGALRHARRVQHSATRLDVADGLAETKAFSTQRVCLRSLCRRSIRRPRSRGR